SSTTVSTDSPANTNLPMIFPRKPNPFKANSVSSFVKATRTTSINSFPLKVTVQGLIGCGQTRWTSPYVISPSENESNDIPAFNKAQSAPVHSCSVHVRYLINSVSLNQSTSIGLCV